MSKVRKNLCCILVVAFAMTIISVLSGCGNANVPASTTAAPQSSGQETPAQTENPVKDFVSLKWYMVQENQTDAAQVFAMANEMIKAEINANVDFQYLPWASFEDKMKLINASGEEYDLAYTSSWINNYANNVSKGSLVELDTLIDRYGPAYKEQIPDFLWNGIKIKGKIYALPNYQVEYTQDSNNFKKDLVDKYNLDISKLAKYEDMGQIFDVIKKNEPSVYTYVPATATELFRSFSETKEQLDYSLPLMVDSNYKVGYIWDDPEFMARYNINYEWSQAGYIPKDPNISKNISANEEAGKVFSTYNTYKPGAEADWLKAHRYEAVYFSYAKPKLSTDMVTAALTGISTSSKNPERAMMLMNLMMSDKDLLNLLTYGIENTHYKKVGDNRIELLDASKNYSMYAWQLGNQFLAYLLPGQEDTVWEDTVKANNEAKPSVTLGFNIDREPVKTEAAAVGAVYKKYEAMMLTASLKPDEFLDKMKVEYNQAGLDALIAAVQKQLDDWKAENGK